MIERKIEAEVNLILTDGGMGDLICELVAVDYNIRNHSQVRFHVWVPDYLYEFAQHVLPFGAKVRPFSEASIHFNHAFEGKTTQWHTDHTPMRTHPVDYGFHMLSDRHVYDLNKKNYLQVNPHRLVVDKFNLPDKYVCIVAAAAEPVKEMPQETLEAVTKYVKSKGYMPVFLGKERADTGFKDLAVTAKPFKIEDLDGINLLNQTSTLEAAGIIAWAKAIVGLDGGLIHLAGCTDTAIVAGYTLVDPVHVAPIRRGSQTYKFHAVEPDKNMHNRYYQTYRSGFQKGDFRQFPSWETVVASMTAEKFVTELEKII